MIPLRKRIVVELYEWAQVEYDCKIIRQQDIQTIMDGTDLLKQAQIERVIDLLTISGVPDPMEHLKRWAVALRDLIIVPWTPGEGTQDDLVRQTRTLGHELKHVEQWIDGPFGFAIYYGSSRSKRAHYECEAMHMDLELYKQITGKMMDTEKMAQKLVDSYYCRPSDGRVSKMHLDAYASTVSQGVVSEEISKAILKFIWNFNI
jgi:hypothetical protein